MNAHPTQLRMMTSGTFTAAHLRLVPELERLTGLAVVTVTTSIGTGDSSIPNRLRRGEVADLVICPHYILRQFMADGLVLREGCAELARSIIGIAVREGAPPPDVSTADALRNTLLRATSIGYSAGESGKYLTSRLFPRLGIADAVMPKCRFIGGGERVGAVIARGEVEIGFQQISELLPVQGIAHITPLPDDVQLISTYAAGVGAASTHPERARAAIQFLTSAAAAAVIRSTGLEPVAG